MYQVNVIIKLLLRNTVHQTSRWESVAAGPTTADSLKDVWWTVSSNYIDLFLSRDVKDTKCNQYLPVVLSSLKLSNWRFWKLVILWMWRHHDIALGRHGCDAWHNALLLTTFTSTAELTLLTTWLHCCKRVIRNISNAGSRASYGPYLDLEVPNYGIHLLHYYASPFQSKHSPTDWKSYRKDDTEYFERRITS